MPVSVRLLTVDDVHAYREIRLATLLTEPDFFGSLYETEAAWPLDRFVSTIEANRVFGAWDAGALVGVARLHSHEGVKERHKASLHGVFVSPEWRGRGVGSAVLSIAIEAARASHEQLVLTVAADNEGAISRYRKLGFAHFGVEPRARKYEDRYSDVMSMVLWLDERGGIP